MTRVFGVEQILNIRCRNSDFRKIVQRNATWKFRQNMCPKSNLSSSEVYNLMTKGDKRPRDHQNPRTLNPDASDLTNLIDWSVEVILKLFILHTRLEMDFY